MEGLEASIVTADIIFNESQRFDAQFFQKAYLADDQALNGHTLSTISEFAFVTDGPHGYHEVDDASPIAMLTAKCASDWFAEREGADTIAKWVDDANKRSSLEVNDLILSTRGTVGNCAAVTLEALPANLDQDVARIAMLGNSPFRPLFLLAYLNSRFGQEHIARHSSGMVQEGLSLAKVRTIPVPLLSEPFQVRVSGTIEESLRLRRETRAKYKQAEDTLLTALGLADWTPPEPLSYTARASDALAAGRLDAQYFSSKFDELLERLSASAVRMETIRDIRSYNARGLQPEYVPAGDVYVVNSRHILEARVDYEGLERTTTEWLKINERSRLHSGDILTYTTGAKIGRTAYFALSDPAVASNHVNILRLSKGNPEYVAFVMNSLVGRLQTERHLSGTAQPELYPGDIDKFIVPFIPDEIQSSITASLRASEESRVQARQFLEATKRAVEIAIEDGEAAAMAFLSQAAGAS